MKCLALVLLPILCAACANSSSWKHGGVAATRLPGRSVYVAVPENGRYEEKHYEKSGGQAADAIVAAVRPRVATVVRGTAPESVDEALKHARAGSLAYVLYPTILHWEDRNAEWSMIPDRIEIELDVLDAASGATLASDTLTGKSGLWTFGGDHPQDLLSEPLTPYINTLF